MEININILKACELILQKKGFQPPSLYQVKEILTADLGSSSFLREGLSAYKNNCVVNLDTADRECFLDSFALYYLPDSEFSQSGWPANSDSKERVQRFAKELTGVLIPLGWTASNI